MNQFTVKVLQVILVFAIALAFYLLTAAFVPYPGVSTDYLTAACFPMSGGSLGAYKLDEWVVYHVIQLAGPSNLVTWTTIFSACCGALVVSLLFLAVKSGVRLSCLDLTGIRDHELARAEQDIVFISRIAGIGTAVVALVALPIWVMGTRILPGILTACVGMAMLSLAIGLRRFCAEDVQNGAWPTVGRQVMMGAVFGLAVFLGTLSPTMIPVALAGILFGGWVLVLPQIEGRLSYFPWIAGGLVLGILASIGVSAAWNSCYGEPSTLSPILLWAQGLKGIAVTLVAMVMTFEGVAPLVFFVATVALFIGTFPRAFTHFGTPIVGQISILALLVLCFARWPGDFWVLLSEPTPLAILGMVMMLLILGLLLASWARNWLDVHTSWKLSKAYLAVAVTGAIGFGFVALCQACQNASAGAGLSARRALSPIREMMSNILPEDCRVWIAPPKNASIFLIHRYASGNPVLPIKDIGKTTELIVLKGKSFADCCLTDEVLAELATVGGAPLVQYLRFSDWGEEILFGSPASKHAAQVESIAALVADMPFGKTPVGKQFIQALGRQAAMSYAAQALQCDDVAAEPLLRKAQLLDPENLGVRLSIGALEIPGRPVTRKDRLAATLVLEENAWLRAPTLRQTESFEALYGPVRTKTFHAATRLRKFLETPESNLESIKVAYLKDPEAISERERVLALLTLTEDEILASFEKREPSFAELESYLCFHLRTEKAMACYKKYLSLLGNNDAMGVLYHNRGTRASDRLHEKAYAFFARDGHFPYAYLYVLGLLEEGDTATAEKFVSGFSFRESLAERPCLMEELRVRVLEAIWAKDQAAAIACARAWLHTDKKQPRIWTRLLRYLSVAQPDQLLLDVRNCLVHYPSHAKASAALADHLTLRYGETAAARWTQSVQRARAEVDLKRFSKE